MATYDRIVDFPRPIQCGIGSYVLGLGSSHVSGLGCLQRRGFTEERLLTLLFVLHVLFTPLCFVPNYAEGHYGSPRGQMLETPTLPCRVHRKTLDTNPFSMRDVDDT